METIEVAAQKIQKALESLGFLIVRESTMKSDQISVVCRMSEDATKLVEGAIYHLLLHEEGWQSHICHRYFCRDKSLKAGWSFTFRSDDMYQAAERISRILRLYKEQYLVPQGGFDNPGPSGSATASSGEGKVTVVRMPGGDRNRHLRGKGAKSLP